MQNLTPTQISINKQAFDTVVKLTGDCQYNGQYYCAHEGEGYLRLTDDISNAKLMRKHDAESVKQMLCNNARHCYGGRFETVKTVN